MKGHELPRKPARNHGRKGSRPVSSLEDQVLLELLGLLTRQAWAPPNAGKPRRTRPLPDSQRWATRIWTSGPAGNASGVSAHVPLKTREFDSEPQPKILSVNLRGLQAFGLGWNSELRTPRLWSSLRTSQGLVALSTNHLQLTAAITALQTLSWRISVSRKNGFTYPSFRLGSKANL